MKPSLFRDAMRSILYLLMRFAHRLCIWADTLERKYFDFTEEEKEQQARIALKIINEILQEEPDRINEMQKCIFFANPPPQPIRYYKAFDDSVGI